MDLSIVIVNWKSAALCADCIESIYTSDIRVSFEIVVIDNASFDGCDAMLAQRFPQVRFVQNHENIGFAGANNLAFSCSSGNVVCFLNPDTIIKGTALQTLYDALINIPGAGAVGALLLNGNGTLQTSCVLPFPTVLNQVLDAEWLRKLFPTAPLFGTRAMFNKIKVPQTVEAVSGACIMIHRKTFVDVGMFSTDYFMYAEDIDLCRKVALNGQKVYLINEATIVHLGGSSSSKQKNRLFSALLIRESNYRMLRKFRGPGYALLYRFWFGIFAMVRLVALFIGFIPAAAAGKGRVFLDIVERWWHLFLWAIGILKAPQSFNTGGG